MALTFHAALKQLEDVKSAKRCSAAKALRKMGNPAAGPALLTALEQGMQGSHTWETRYHLAMALGACHYGPALTTLQDIAQTP